ncbi:MAG: ATP-dependent Clp protease ATP-binding subunit [Candidatus Didemnitutus sp.]|nr:ATP-dependent Clp protease ATP-binding subunit [Candidatus Didemnitutus sp.]
MLDPERLHRVQGLPAHLRANLRGQDHVVVPVAASLARVELGLSPADRPKRSFLFLGPTGVGKTELALLCARFLYGPDGLHRFDLSEFDGANATQRLLGANRTDRGLLGDRLARSNGGLLLFDEVEKADPKVWDLFLQILESARVTVATGETFSLSAWVIVLTSNLGGAEAMRMEHSSNAAIEAAVLRRAGQAMRPELFGRIEEKHVFARLSPSSQREIASLLVARETARLRRLGHDLEVSPEALEFLICEGFDPHLGARPLRGVVERQLQELVVNALILSGQAQGRVVLTAPRKLGLLR